MNRRLQLHHLLDVARATPQGEFVGLTLDEVRDFEWHVQGTIGEFIKGHHFGRRLTILGKPVAIIPADWRSA